MIRRIFRSICLAVMVVLLATVGLILGVLHSYFTTIQLQQLRTETTLAAQGVTHEGIAYFDSIPAMDCRITWIAGDGTVLYDSHHSSGELENHLERSEVRDALESGYGESIRYSDTIMEQSLYAALRLEDGTVLRLSNEQDSVLTLLLGMLQPMVLIIIAAAAPALGLASRLSKRIVSPLNSLNLNEPLSNKEYPEITPLLTRIDSQQAQLRQQADALKSHQKRFDTVTRSMSEGLVLLDNKNTVLSMNPAAARQFGTTRDCIGIDFLTVNRSAPVCELIYQALTGKKGEQNVQLGDVPYHMISSPVRTEGIVTGVVLLLFDLTEKQKAEALRREFTANVSHELKTPLHAISGYAELMKSGMVPPQDTPQFSEKIYTEAQRMIRLVEDTLRLSRLDEGGEDMAWNTVDLYAYALETVQHLSGPAELAGIRLELEGNSVPTHAIPQLVSGILFNLTDNAIKYNRPGGKVTIRITETPDSIRLTVSDTGIGIPDEHRERIFERFYRVDKSHSKEVGGTGLGLSIVKHAAQILGAKIELESTPGEGTSVTVDFRK